MQCPRVVTVMARFSSFPRPREEEEEVTQNQGQRLRKEGHPVEAGMLGHAFNQVKPTLQRES